MVDFERGVEMMDRPEIIERLFFPRRDFDDGSSGAHVMTRFVAAGDGVSIGCRFYPSREDGPTILFYHGNGETAGDYDYVAPAYGKRGINLFVADYRGYGLSGGSPTCSAMVRDSSPIFEDFLKFLDEHGFTGGRFVMGRSLGSAPAIETAYRFQAHLKGLIVESGFASAKNQFRRLGVTHLFRDARNAVGFGNDLKIARVTIPTLIIHGEDDTIIPADEGRALLRLSGATEKTSLFIAQAGHNDLFMMGFAAYMGAIERFTAA
jgi:alpha-beta hydrolase superfamily lysophospholipase